MSAGNKMEFPKLGTSQFPLNYLTKRQIGREHRTLGLQDELYRDLYSSFELAKSWDYDNDSELRKSVFHGAVFNLEFCPDGRTLLASCEQKSLLVFDPLTQKLINCIPSAHDDCVNCVRFLDTRTFATCSDDTTVALWDIRNLSQKICSLRGHSNWVKNIEFSHKENLLVTSGFDGSVFTWDINRYTETGLVSQRVFNTSGLMRMRLTPDDSKMVICTSGGYMLIVHDLDLSNLSSDLAGFKPNMYRLMQISQAPIAIAANYDSLFTSPRNRVELVADWPQGNEAEVISSLQIHPQGWCVLSRNTSNDERSEWTCVHDIQSIEKLAASETSNSRKRRASEIEEVESESSVSPVAASSSEDESSPPLTSSPSGGPQVEVRITAPLQWVASPGENAGFQLRVGSREQRAQPEEDRLEVRIPSEEIIHALERIRRVRDRVTANRNSWRIRRRRPENMSIEIPEPEADNNNTAGAVNEASGSADQDPNLVDRTAHFVRAVADLAARSVHLMDPFQLRSRNSLRRHPPSLTGGPPVNLKIQSNYDRLTHYIQEANVGRGYIKELCFSADGRIIASPFGYGIRLLAFNPRCTEVSYDLPSSVYSGSCYHSEAGQKPAARPLHEVKTILSHSNVVVTTKFAPFTPTMVSGCLGGKVVWHQPVF